MQPPAANLLHSRAHLMYIKEDIKSENSQDDNTLVSFWWPDPPTDHNCNSSRGIILIGGQVEQRSLKQCKMQDVEVQYEKQCKKLQVQGRCAVV